MTEPALLAGRRVVEIAARPAGGYCGRLLLLLGAAVTRVAVPQAVDCPPELLGLYEVALHRGKRILQPDDEGLPDALAAADLVVVDSAEDDAADGAVVDLTQRLLTLAPDAATVDIADLREDLGAAVPATASTAAAAAGMSWGIGDPDREPLTLPYDIPEYLTGTEAAAAAALALLVRALGGPAQRWDVTTADVLSYFVGQIGANFLPYDRPWHRDGPRASMSGGSYPAAMFPCRDGWVSIMCRIPREYAGLVAAMGDPDWSRRPGFDDPRVVARLHADEVDPHLIAWTSARTRDEVFAAGRKHGFPVAPVLTIAEAMEHEQFAHRGFFDTMPDGTVLPGSPYRLTGPAASGATTPSSWPPATIDPAAPLAGLRVLDLSWVWSGPMVTAALRDLGAQVIKIEHRGRADPARLRGRAIRGGVPVDGPELEVTPYFNQMNHGKRSVAVDMGTTEGAMLIRRIAESADVVVENMRPGALERRGLGYAELSGANPALVMVSMTMMGQTGPLAGIRGYAPVMSGLAGLDSLVGYGPDRLIGTFNPALGDPNGAGHALAAVLAGLAGRGRGGTGCHIDLAQVEALLSIMPVPILRRQVNGTVPIPANGHSAFHPHAILPTREADGWVAVAARTDLERSAVDAVVGEEGLAAWVAGRTAGDAVQALRAAGVPAAEVAGYTAAVAGKRAVARGVATTVTHPYLGEQPVVTVPWKADGRGFPAAGPAPLLGADTEPVLTGLLGLGPADLADLRARGIVE
ncbi:CoA transferase [Pseudonocardia halophobica]|uniref:CoA transferase n=1 Tax=Pseudonocardia halophobica TaxID=29401 RepID=A0A9W6P0Z0_9PSEU|nr:CoA transferase [Pseudonocardia halophobica]GLL15839.1 CoA transferase [Pseudonocardia halophobica]